jgi:drug/metabolite transporter (DMT)-like permease
MKTQTKMQARHTLMLVLCALIWGMAFVAQSVGSGLGAYTFLACRSWLALFVLYPTLLTFDHVRKKRGEPCGWPQTKEGWQLLARGGLVCGTLLFAASAAQQIAITLDPSTAKASFITAMYVVLVPLVSLVFGRRNGPQLWCSVAISVAGLYLLCMQGGFGSVHTSDLILMLCALLFSFQIMAVDHYSPRLDGVRLSLAQFLTTAVWSTICAFVFETPRLADIAANALPLAYCGFLSSGVAYTLQILGQNGLNPAVASLAMCLESVFGALGGWLVLRQSLSARELAGCVLIFAAVVLAQLPVGDWLRGLRRDPHGTRR